MAMRCFVCVYFFKVSLGLVSVGWGLAEGLQLGFRVSLRVVYDMFRVGLGLV